MEAGPNNFIDPLKQKRKRVRSENRVLFNEVRIVQDDGSEAGSNEPGNCSSRKAYFNYYWNQEGYREVLKDGWLYPGDL